MNATTHTAEVTSICTRPPEKRAAEDGAVSSISSVSGCVVASVAASVTASVKASVGDEVFFSGAGVTGDGVSSFVAITGDGVGVPGMMGEGVTSTVAITGDGVGAEVSLIVATMGACVIGAAAGLPVTNTSTTVSITGDGVGAGSGSLQSEAQNGPLLRTFGSSRKVQPEFKNISSTSS